MAKLAGRSSLVSVIFTRSSCVTSSWLGVKVWSFAMIVNSRRFWAGSCPKATTKIAKKKTTKFTNPILARVLRGFNLVRFVVLAARSAVAARAPIFARRSVAGRRGACRRAFSRAFSAGRSRRGAAFFRCDQRFARQANLAGRVDRDHLHQDLLAFLQLVTHVLDAVVRDLRDVQEAVG